MLSDGTIFRQPFTKWIWQDKENKRLLLVSSIISFSSFTLIKFLYPYPNFMPPDSYSYLEAAYNNKFIDIWAIGYSKFLRLVSSFSNSHLILTIIQYLILQFSLLYLLFSLQYLFGNTNKWFSRITFAIILLNPLFPHIANFISSDCLFTALSLIWFTQICFILYQPTKTLLIQHAFVLLLTFMVRHNALYYPFLSIAGITWSSLQPRYKWVTSCTLLSLLTIFIAKTVYEYSKKIGIPQYSAFAGWQMAANALYGYAYTNLDSPESVPKKYRGLHTVVNKHMDSIRLLAVRPDNEVGIYYLWDFKSPLRIYMDQQTKSDTTSTYFKKWASLAPLYNSYGAYLIKRYPVPFLKNFAWSNFKRWFVPPSSFMGTYNLGNTTVRKIAVLWFGWKNNKLIKRVNSDKIVIADVFTIITPIVNIIFLTGFISFYALNGFSKYKGFKCKIICFALAAWITNALFSIFSAPIELRYQLFSITISFIFAIIFISHILELISVNQNLFIKQETR